MAAAILNAAQPAQVLAGRTAPMAATQQADQNTASDASATITANDFLTLLVTEMRNQDPTANTDPNEYINQLVQVNSLEQLIGIHQTLTTALGSSGSAAQPSTPPQARTSAPAAHAVPKPAAGARTASAALTGNLSAPVARPAARRLAHALDGSQAGGAGPALR